MPAAMPAPMMAPIDEPAIAVGVMPSSSSASMTWICARPRAPPPPKAMREGRPATPVTPAAAQQPGASSLASVLDRRLARPTITRGLGGQQLRAAALHLVQRHRFDQVVAALDIVDAEIVELQFDQRAGDRRGGVQIVDRIGADDVFLGRRQFLLGRALSAMASPRRESRRASRRRGRSASRWR